FVTEVAIASSLISWPEIPAWTGFSEGRTSAKLAGGALDLFLRSGVRFEELEPVAESTFVPNQCLNRDGAKRDYELQLNNLVDRSLDFQKSRSSAVTDVHGST